MWGPSLSRESLDLEVGKAGAGIRHFGEAGISVFPESEEFLVVFYCFYFVAILFMNLAKLEKGFCIDIATLEECAGNLCCVPARGVTGLTRPGANG